VADAFSVPLVGFTMQLRRSELEDVAAGLGQFASSADDEGDLLRLVEVLRRLPERVRAPTWELSVRHFGRHKPLARAAGEIGLDVIYANALLERFSASLVKGPAAEEHEK
jgi:hypothetical protein